jgi:pilus assembly protein CpaF
MNERPLFSETVLQFFAPVRDFLLDEDVSEVLINGAGEIYVERGGRLELTDRAFQSPESLLAAVRNVSQFVGRTIDVMNPYLDARLPDGSRLHAMLPPMARRGPYVSIRRFSGKLLEMSDLVKRGALSAPVAELLRACVLARKNIAVSGGTGSGKTTLLNLLSSFIPAQERIIVIEDASELRLKQAHVLPMEARHPDHQGRGAVTIRDLLACSLRLRPDRIVVGECRGGEALDMLQAMNTGHAGSLTTVHANSCRDALSRLETLALMSGVELPLTAVRGQVASALDLVVQVARLADGSRRLTEIGEVLDLDEEGRYRSNLLLSFAITGKDPESGRLLGELRPVGPPPACLRDLTLVDPEFDPRWFGWESSEA